MKKFRKLLLTQGTFLIGATLASNFLNLIFNAYLGRVLTFEEFGLVTLINTFVYLTGIVLNALGSTINHRVAYLTARVSREAGIAFYRAVLRNGVKIGIVATILWLLFSGVIATYFKANIMPILLFTPILTIGFINAANKGFLNGTFFFALMGVSFLTESAVKIATAFILVNTGLSTYTYLAIPIGIIASFLVVAFVPFLTLFKNPKNKKLTKSKFPSKFFTASMVTGLSTQIFLTMDVILAKHYLSPTDAGIYALLSLIGKMIFFFGSLFNIFIIPMISREEGLNHDPNKIFYRLFAATFVLTMTMYTGIGVLGHLTLPIVFGTKINSILPYLTNYTLAISLFTLANTIVGYHLVRHHYSFPIAAIFISIGMVVGIVFSHNNIFAITSVLLTVSIVTIIVVTILHFLQRNGGFLVRNLVDMLCLFIALPKTQPAHPKGKRILIFNWRDIKHVFGGGAEVYIHELAKRWVKAGNKVTLFCGNDGKCPRYEIIDGVEIIRRGGFYFVYIWAFFYYIFKFRKQYDVIIDSENGIPFFTPLYAHEKKFLLIHHVHQEVFRTSLKPPFSWFATFLEIKFMPYVYKNIQILTVSPSSKEEIMEHKLTAIEPEIIYNGVDLGHFKPGAKNKKPLLLYLGRLKYYKSIDVFIKAVQEVLKTVPELEIVIAGDGEMRHTLIQLTKKLGLDQKVKFIGKVSEKKKIELYQKAWIMINPSRMEGWGITTIEANACATPVIASDVPGLRDSVKNPHTGFLVPHGDVEAFAHRILELLSNEKLRNKMARQAVEWAKNFEWQKSANKSLHLINEHI